jgi:uncharacterized protein with HEPN domain
MYDKELVEEILRQISNSIRTIQYRFKPIRVVDDFLSTPEGMEKLDAICMQLIAIGESLKNLDKITNGSLLSAHPEIDWRGAKGMRDIICHHYFDIDAEAIFLVCQEKLGPLADAIEEMRREI